MAKCSGCSSTGCNCDLQVMDTSDIDLILTGSGDSDDPWILSADFTGSTGGGGSNDPFIIVAAADTDPARQATADYVCDGIADEVEINLACAQADNWGASACVLLLAGEYYLADKIVTGYAHSFRGEGAEATWIYYDANGDAPAYNNTLWYEEFALQFNGEHSVLSDFYLNQYDSSGTGFRGGIQVYGGHSTIERLWIEIDGNDSIQQVQNAAIKYDNEGIVVQNCRIECYDGTAIDWSRDLGNNVVQNCFIGACTGVDINGTATGEMVLNNFFDGGGVAGSNPNNGHAVGETYHYRLNTGISVIGSVSNTPVIISGNKIGGFGKGILLDSTEQIIVTDNVIDRADFGDDEQAILIQEGSWYCNITNNVLRPGYAGRMFSVGIEVTADCGSNEIIDNDVFGSGSGTFFEGGRLGAFNDNGVYTRHGHQFITVASEDTQDTLKYTAHFICDGVDDDVEIQAAVDLLGNFYPGGEIVLLSGNFWLNNTVQLNGIAIRIRAAAPASTYINFAGPGAAIRGGNSYDDGITIIEGITFDGDATAVDCNQAKMLIRECVVSSDGDGLPSFLNGYEGTTIQDCVINNAAGIGVLFNIGYKQCSVIGCTISAGSGIVNADSDECTFRDNIIRGVGTQTVHSPGTAARFIEYNCGISCLQGSRNFIYGNQIEANSHGILLDESGGNLVFGNMDDSGGDSIRIKNTAGFALGNNENVIQNNKIYSGIRVLANCADHFITNNDFKGGPGLTDGGTGTITVAGNRF